MCQNSVKKGNEYSLCQCAKINLTFILNAKMFFATINIFRTHIYCYMQFRQKHTCCFHVVCGSNVDAAWNCAACACILIVVVVHWSSVCLLLLSSLSKGCKALVMYDWHCSCYSYRRLLQYTVFSAAPCLSVSQ